jgi:hypothetical protein
MARMGRKAAGKLLITAALLAVVVLGPTAADAGVPIKTGKYTGKTVQAAVAASFRTIGFTVRKGKVTLTTEPTVARESCLSAPVFTLGGATATTKLGRNGSFTFTHTLLGTTVDRIHGRFVSPTEVEGFAIYHFSAQDLCSAGRSQVSFTAKR